MCNGSGAASSGGKETVAEIFPATNGRALVNYAKDALPKAETKDMKFQPTIATFQRTSTGRTFYNVPFQSKKETKEYERTLSHAPQHAVRVEQKPGVGAGLGEVSVVRNYKAGEL